MSNSPDQDDTDTQHNYIITQDYHRRLNLNLLVALDLPVETFQTKAWQEYMYAINPALPNVPATAARDDLQEVYNAKRNRMFAAIAHQIGTKGSINLCLEEWNANGPGERLLSVSAHWIDKDMDSHRIILSVLRCGDAQDHQTSRDPKDWNTDGIGWKLFEHLSTSWYIEPYDIQSITCVRVSGLIEAARSFRSDIPPSSASKQYPVVLECQAALIYEIAMGILKPSTDFDVLESIASPNSLPGFRAFGNLYRKMEIIARMLNDGRLRSRLRALIAEYDVHEAGHIDCFPKCNKVDDDWYYSLSRLILSHHEAIKIVVYNLEEQEDLCLNEVTFSPVELEVIARLVKILKFLSETTSKLRSSRFPGSHETFVHLFLLRERLRISSRRERNRVLNRAIMRSIERLDLYLCNAEKDPQLYFSVFLDPRWKSKAFDNLALPENERFGIMDKVAAFREYCTEARIRFRHIKTSSFLEAGRNEWDVYLEEPVARGVDILTWWGMQRYKFPLLYLLSRRILAMQATSISTDGCFGGKARDTHPDLMESKADMVICLRSWSYLSDKWVDP